MISTDEVYGDLPFNKPDLFFTEEAPIHTSNPYSSSKTDCELGMVGSYEAEFIDMIDNVISIHKIPEKIKKY